nr:MAG TPA: hypothetical protein [Caudoviricetes sp.]
MQLIIVIIKIIDFYNLCMIDMVPIHLNGIKLL